MTKTKNPIFKCMHRGEKGFTLIELLVVIAILGVIAAVVALNVAGFFGEGTLQAANTELHQAQTAIVAAMATVESSDISVSGTTWAGEPGYVIVTGANNVTADAATFCYGPFRAAYTVSDNATIGLGAITYGNPDIDGGWGTGISWNSTFMNWQTVS